jgi:hypothetical protein
VSDYCDFTDLPAEMCAHCLGVEGDERGVADAWTAAKFDSRCQMCRAPISEGDRIGLLDQVWVCEECAS